MYPRLTTCCLLIAALAVAFESGEQKERKRALKAAAKGLRLGDYKDKFSLKEVQCAACEATARSFENEMKLGRHRGDGVGRLSMLYAACEHMDDQIPMEMDSATEGAGKVLHFFNNPQVDVSKLGSLGLGEFCTTMVEEFEEELADKINGAEAAVATGMPVRLRAHVSASGCKQAALCFSLCGRHVCWHIRDEGELPVCSCMRICAPRGFVTVRILSM